MGRDRSASLNYHSLIYGDARKKTDRSQNLSPMVPTRDQSLDLFQEQGEELFLLWKVVTVTLDGGVYSVLYCAWLLDNYYACCLFLPGFCEICQEICVGFARNKCCHI